MLSLANDTQTEDTLRIALLEKLADDCLDYAKSEHFDHVDYHAYFPKKGTCVGIDRLPGKWRNYYESKGFGEIDPRTRHCYTNTAPVCWNNIEYQSGHKGKLEREVITAARLYGLVQGISVPVHAPGLECGVLNVSSSSRTKEPCGQTLAKYKSFAQHTHDALKLIYQDDELPACSSSPLTKREEECLKWTANGKTSWEISQILGIKESTVSYHIRQSTIKLSARNRSEAIAKAIAMTHIKPF